MEILSLINWLYVIVVITVTEVVKESSKAILADIKQEYGDKTVNTVKKVATYCIGIIVGVIFLMSKKTEITGHELFEYSMRLLISLSVSAMSYDMVVKQFKRLIKGGL